MTETFISASSRLQDDRKFWTETKKEFREKSVDAHRLRLVYEFSEDERSFLTIDRLRAVGVSGNIQSRRKATLPIMNLILGVLDMDPIEPESTIPDSTPPNYSKEDEYAQAKIRGHAQSLFSQTVKDNYGNKCAVTGISTTEFLVAAHIVPWSADKKTRLDPANGICLSVLVDKAYEHGYLKIDENLVISVDDSLAIQDPTVYAMLSEYAGRKISLPVKGAPRQEYLRRRIELVSAVA